MLRRRGPESRGTGGARASTTIHWMAVAPARCGRRAVALRTRNGESPPLGMLLHRFGFALLVVACSLGVAGAAPPLRDGHGLHIESQARLDDRQLDAQVRTAALQHTVDIRILLPTGYDTNLRRRYP